MKAEKTPLLPGPGPAARGAEDVPDEHLFELPATGGDAEEGQASAFATTVNIANNLVGAGVLTMSWSFMKSTLFTGAALALFICALNGFTFVLLARCAEMSGSFNYRVMGERALGPAWGTFMQVSMLLYTFGSSISYLILTGDFLSSASGVFSFWAPDTLLTSRQFVLSVIAVVVLIPLVSLPTLNKLRHVSSASLLCMGFAVVVIIIEFANGGMGSGVRYLGLPASIGEAAPIISVSFCCHYLAPRYYQEMKDRSIRKFSWSVAAAVGSCFALYTTVAVCGYLAFGDLTESDILENYDADDKKVLVARLALSFVIISTYPMSFFSLRQSALTLCFGSDDRSDTRRYVLTSAVLLVITVVPGMFLTDVGIVLDYKGAIFGSMIVYIFPALIFARLKARVRRRTLSGASINAPGEGLAPEGTVGALLLTKASRASLLIVVWGVSMGVLGVVTTTMSVMGDEP